LKRGEEKEEEGGLSQQQHLIIIIYNTHFPYSFEGKNKGEKERKTAYSIPEYFLLSHFLEKKRERKGRKEYRKDFNLPCARPYPLHMWEERRKKWEDEQYHTKAPRSAYHPQEGEGEGEGKIRQY